MTMGLDTEPWCDPERPCLDVAGARVEAYVLDREELVVEVDCDDADAEMFEGEYVPLTVAVEGRVVYQSDAEGVDDFGVERHPAVGRPVVIVRPGEPVLVFGDIEVLTTADEAREYLLEFSGVDHGVG